MAKDFSSADAIVTAWMNSPTHKANLLSGKYKDIGIAVVDGRLNGSDTTLVVQMFGSPQTNIPEVDANNNGVVRSALAESNSLSSRLSPFSFSRSVSISFVLLVTFTLALDWFVVWRRNIIRISGKTWAHLTFMATILIMILIIKQGLILNGLSL